MMRNGLLSSNNWLCNFSILSTNGKCLGIRLQMIGVGDFQICRRSGLFFLALSGQDLGDLQYPTILRQVQQANIRLVVVYIYIYTYIYSIIPQYHPYVISPECLQNLPNDISLQVQHPRSRTRAAGVRLKIALGEELTHDGLSYSKYIYGGFLK